MGCVQKKSIVEPAKGKAPCKEVKASQENVDIPQENKIKNENSPVVNKVSPTPQNLKITENPIIVQNYTTLNNQKIIIDTKQMINDSGRLEEHYKVLNKLGQGTFGSVYRVVHIKTDQIRAMKMIKKSTINLQDDDRKFLKEIQILIQIDHPNIIKIFEYFQDETYFYVITEFVSGGELYDTISKWKNFNEDKAAYIMRQLLSAVNYLHFNHIMHRDLKPENMMVEKQNKRGKDKTNTEYAINIKLIDFGTCNYFDSKNKLSLKVGTPYYIAPEVLKRSYDEKCDIWSCGVILYILLCGYPPFGGDSTEEIIESVLEGKFTMDGPEWSKISSSAKDLVMKLLELNPSKRLSAQEAINHKWIQEKHEKNEEKIDSQVYSHVLENIKNFNAKEKLQQATIAFIVHFQFAAQENRELKKIFKKLDKNGDGQLTYKELKDGFCQLDASERLSGVTEADLNRIIEEVDQDNNGYIEYEEFLRVAVNKKAIISEKNLRMAFDKFDENKDGQLSLDEIKKVLGTTDNLYLQQLISRIDGDDNGQISFEEFSRMMKVILEESEANKNSTINLDNMKNKKVNNLPTKTILDFSEIDKNLNNKVNKNKNNDEKILMEFDK